MPVLSRNHSVFPPAGPASEGTRTPGVASMSASPSWAPPPAAAAARVDKQQSQHPQSSKCADDAGTAGQTAVAATATHGCNALSSAAGCPPPARRRQLTAVSAAASAGRRTAPVCQPRQCQLSTAMTAGAPAVGTAGNRKRKLPVHASTHVSKQQQQQQQPEKCEQVPAAQNHKKRKAQATEPTAASTAAAIGTAAVKGLVAPGAAVAANDVEWPCEPLPADSAPADEAAANSTGIAAHATKTLNRAGIQLTAATGDSILKHGILPPGTRLDLPTARGTGTAKNSHGGRNVIRARFLVREAAASTGSEAAGSLRHALQCVVCGAQCTTLKAADEHAAGKSGRPTKRAADKLLLVGTGGVSLRQFLESLPDHARQHSTGGTTAAASTADKARCSGQQTQCYQQQKQARHALPAKSAHVRKTRAMQQQQQQVISATQGQADSTPSQKDVSAELLGRPAIHQQQRMRSAAAQHPTGTSSRRTDHKQQQEAIQLEAQTLLQQLHLSLENPAVVEPAAAAAVGAAGLPDAAAMPAACHLGGSELQQAVVAGQQEQQGHGQEQWQQLQGVEDKLVRSFAWLDGVLDDAHQQQLIDLLLSGVPANIKVAHLMGGFWFEPCSSAVAQRLLLDVDIMEVSPTGVTAAGQWDWDRVRGTGLAHAAVQMLQTAVTQSSCQVNWGMLQMCGMAAKQAFAVTAAHAVSAAAAAASAAEGSLVEHHNIAHKLGLLVILLLKLAQKQLTSDKDMQYFSSMALSVVTVGCLTIEILAVPHASSSNSGPGSSAYCAAADNLDALMFVSEQLNKMATKVSADLWKSVWGKISRDAERWTRRCQRMQQDLSQQHPYAWLNVLQDQLVKISSDIPEC